ncbi:MAG: PD-(D/E)XK nuclease domain-containing protein, partial [Muribaculaceae bacterium]|nr:PD-(D/E)XK nuclease domain-containing protein [Muribaculaceae bacterium]
SAQTAIEQIESKGYMRPYERSGKQLTAVGVNFSSEQRTISDWKIQQVKII